MEKILFPHEEMRGIQEELVKDIYSAIQSSSHIIAHAPTGLGKTAAALAPAITYAKEHKKKIFFLTSRHTQHEIAIETIKKIKLKHDIQIPVADIIGKKHFCLQPAVSILYNKEFIEYCKNMVEKESCEFYNQTHEKSGLSVRAKNTITNIKNTGSYAVQEIIDACNTKTDALCPYEITQVLAKEAQVIIADYFYIFNTDIREAFLKKINTTLAESIIVIDEAHNLPDRLRELMTSKLSSFILSRAQQEAKEMNYSEAMYTLGKINQFVIDIAQALNRGEFEILVAKESLIMRIEEWQGYDKTIQELSAIGEEIRKLKKRSYIASIAEFLSDWRNGTEGYIRYITRDKEKPDQVSLIKRCLDPSIISKEVISEAHSIIMMSGTLTPTSMYRDLLGFDSENTIEKEYQSPFPKANKLSLIIPQTSTKFTMRSDEQYKKIATIAAEAGNAITGNIAIFFPSYDIMAKVNVHFKSLYQKTIFNESPKMSPDEKKSLIERFKGYEKTGAALLAAATGSFGEGIDLPGDLLKGVIVVGLPLQKPDLETQELIQYYDHKFGKGWDYGYVFPAFNKTLQNAGRCIRSENDKGVIIFLDERYAWNQYLRCFPKDAGIKITNNYRAEIVEFFW